MHNKNSDTEDFMRDFKNINNRIESYIHNFMQEIICSITQPHYLPWKGYFNLIKKQIYLFS